MPLLRVFCWALIFILRFGARCFAVWDLRLTWTQKYYYCNQTCREKQESNLLDIELILTFITQYLSDVRACVIRHCWSIFFMLDYINQCNFLRHFSAGRLNTFSRLVTMVYGRKWSRLDSAETWFLTTAEVVCQNLKFLNLTLVNLLCNY